MFYIQFMKKKRKYLCFWKDLGSKTLLSQISTIPIYASSLKTKMLKFYSTNVKLLFKNSEIYFKK